MKNYNLFRMCTPYLTVTVDYLTVINPLEFAKSFSKLAFKFVCIHTYIP